jgi:hypothetical protein
MHVPVIDAYKYRENDQLSVQPSTISHCQLRQCCPVTIYSSNPKQKGLTAFFLSTMCVVKWRRYTRCGCEEVNEIKLCWEAVTAKLFLNCIQSAIIPPKNGSLTVFEEVHDDNTMLCGIHQVEANRRAPIPLTKNDRVVLLPKDRPQ